MAQGTGTSAEDAPYRAADAVTPSDATVLPWTDALWVGGTGDVTVRMRNGNATFTGVPAGYLLKVSADQVLSTDTTATDIVALYYSKN